MNLNRKYAEIVHVDNYLQGQSHWCCRLQTSPQFSFEGGTVQIEEVNISADGVGTFLHPPNGAVPAVVVVAALLINRSLDLVPEGTRKLILWRSSEQSHLELIS